MTAASNSTARKRNAQRCACGSPDAYSLTPGEQIAHQADGCTIAAAPDEAGALTDGEQNALACFCHDRICPIHNEGADGYIEYETGDLLARVARIKAEAVQAERERLVLIAENYDEEPHSDECGYGACVRCVVDEFSALRSEGR